MIESQSVEDVAFGCKHVGSLPGLDQLDATVLWRWVLEFDWCLVCLERIADVVGVRLRSDWSMSRVVRLRGYLQLLNREVKICHEPTHTQL